MLTYDLSKCGKLPKYTYLYQCIREDIISGLLKPQSRLPAKRALAQHLNLGIITVANAYEQLLTEGYIVSEERKGYFVQEIPKCIDRINRQSQTLPMEPAEREFFADFKANRISLKLFPVATWNQLMRKSLYQNHNALFKTVPYNGLWELRAAIADYLLQNRGMQVSPTQIIIGAGIEYLYNRLTQLFGRANTFGFETPGYTKLASISGAFGNPCKFIPIDKSGLRADLLEESGADIVHISPANQFPTGLVMPITRRLEIFEWAYRAQKRYIIEDDYDSEFRYRGTYIAPMFTEDSQNKVIYMNSFSKTMVPSLRISYMVLPPKLLEQYKNTMSFYSCTVSSFEQYTLAQFISGGYFERHINHLKNYYRKIRLQILEELKKSNLSTISKIVEHNSGTHFLLHINTKYNEEKIRQMGKFFDLHLVLYSDYAVSSIEQEGCTLVINYAGLVSKQIPNVVRRLEKIFLKDYIS